MMTRTTLLMLTLIAAVLLAGCGEEFPDQEAHFGLENKIRPYEITLDPPEAAPGETVTATIRYHMPWASAAQATWRVALDFDSGLYETDQVERAFVGVPDVDAAVVDAEGFVSQVARFIVPSDIYAVTSAIPEVLTDEFILELLHAVPDGLLSDPPRKSEVAAFLADLTADDLVGLDDDARAVIHRLADIFACAVRFRVTLEDDMNVDVVRRLTVRHSGRLGSANTNTNAEISLFIVGEIPRHDFDLDDLEDVESEIIWHAFDEVSADGHALARVPLDSGHTYLMRVRVAPEYYTSPFDDVRELEEETEPSWYYYRLDAPGSGHQFFVNEIGEEAEAYELDEDSRIDPPSVGSSFRVLAVVHDERGEWQRYHASPGSTTRMVEVEFVAP